MPFLRALLLSAACALAVAADAAARPTPVVTFVPTALPPVGAGSTETLAVILRTPPGSPPRDAKVELKVPAGAKTIPATRSIRLRPGGKATAFFKLSFSREAPDGATITAMIDSRESGCVQIGGSYDLEAVRWKAKLDASRQAAAQGWMKPDFDDSAWQERYLPSMWNDTGVTYLRTRLFVPESWRSKPVYLRIRAVDDSDVCYLNGIEIGRTSGWDRQRSYLVDPAAIRYGRENVLCLAVDNLAYGGGIYRSPSSFGLARSPSPPPPLPQGERGASASPARGDGAIARPQPIGQPMPFRRMSVERGVLRYEDGGEVALWGVNYYPQSWYQFENMKRLGVDMKKAIRDDLDDMKRMGVQVIRIHVFDREISDRAGNLIENEHLDLLDYLVSEGSKRGIYFMFTPIAWWGGPNENPDSFSARTPKEFMFCDEPAIAAQASYLENWLNHRNAYTGNRYKDEPAICALEIMNEPAYADYNNLTDPTSSYYPYSDPNFTRPFKQRLMKRWTDWCASNGIGPESRFFPLFRYEVMSRYLDIMYRAIRHTGAKQPVACALFDTAGREDLIEAIADSRCEAVTTGAYAGAWDKVGDGVNYLPYTSNDRLDARLNSKARLIYEFDGIKTFGTYLYPAFARKFRNLGAQICCVFQYDSATTAEWNTDWDAHYLNWRYTPGKAVSFLIGGKVFHDMPRGKAYPTVGTEQRFGNCAVSFDRNISLYCDDRVYISTAPAGEWSPLRVPEKPEMVVAVGDSPFARYSGTGIYSLRIDHKGRAAVLDVEPDAVVVGDPWHPKHDKSAVVLKDQSHPFTLALGGVNLTFAARCEDAGDQSGKMTELPIRDNTFEVCTGRYYLMW